MATETTEAVDHITLNIEGMTCAGCASTVEKALSRAPGVVKASVNLPLKKAQIDVSPGATDADALSEVVRASGYDVKRDTRKVTLEIGGMTCAGCVSTVEKSLKGVPGVSAASVNLATKRAVVEYDAAVATVDAMTKAVANSGYTAALESGSRDPGPAADDELAQARRRFRLAWALTAPMAILMVFHMTHLWMPPFYEWIELVLAIPVLAVAGRETFAKGWKTSMHLTPNMDALIALGTGAAFITAPLAIAGLPVASYGAVAAMIMAFHLTGRDLEAQARGRASQAIRELLELGAKTARVEKMGVEVEIPVDEIQVNDVMVIRPGEKSRRTARSRRARARWTNRWRRASPFPWRRVPATR